MIGEAALVALAAAIYLFDCVVLLERGQALIEARGRNMALSFGSRHYQISGKVVALMNPLTPFLPAFCSLPLFSGTAGIKLGKAVRAHAPLAIPAAMQFVIVFVVLPLCLYRAPGWPLLVTLALAYLNAVVMLVFLFLNFRKNSIPVRPLAGLGFGWIVCLPLSVNCLRASGVGMVLGVDAASAIRLVPDSERPRARADLAGQVAEAMQETDEADSHHAKLAELAQRLEPEAGHGRL
ncbi:MAG TPA: hypothetical protein VHN19_17000 [Burkholderiales bacterium]|jgi:hypothetical protein|nr:hypothetical protein [Burkholderiales bacterium]